MSNNSNFKQCLNVRSFTKVFHYCDFRKPNMSMDFYNGFPKNIELFSPSKTFYIFAIFYNPYVYFKGKKYFKKLNFIKKKKNAMEINNLILNAKFQSNA